MRRATWRRGPISPVRNRWMVDQSTPTSAALASVLVAPRLAHSRSKSSALNAVLASVAFPGVLWLAVTQRPYARGPSLR